MAKRSTNLLTSRPDRGPSPRRGWWAPVAQPYKEEVETDGSGHEIHHRHCSSPQNPNPIRGWAAAAGSATSATSTALYYSGDPLRQRHSSTTPSSARRRHHDATAPTVAALVWIVTKERRWRAGRVPLEKVISPLSSLFLVLDLGLSCTIESKDERISSDLCTV